MNRYTLFRQDARRDHLKLLEGRLTKIIGARRVVDGDVFIFGTLEHTHSQPMPQWIAFGIGVVIHGLGLGALILLGVLDPSEIEHRTYRPPVYVDLRMPTPHPALPVVPPKSALALQVLKSPPLKIHAPVLPPPRPAPDPNPPKLSPTDLPPLAAPSIHAESKPMLPPVQTGVGGGNTKPATLKLPRREVQTGGFGDPTGLPVKDAGASRGNVAVLGAFDLPAGVGDGNGPGGTRGARGTLASAGFGPGIAGPSGGSIGDGGPQRGEVRPSGFDMKPVEQLRVAPSRLPENPLIVPVEILSKPRPVYTEEARKMRVQGEVVLSVVFEASGKLRVLGVVRGLGYGLDEAARNAAEQIRFRPAQRDGQPVDFAATLRVVFELAG